MAGLLTEFLRDRMRSKFEVGVTDCALFIADWVKANGGRDPASAFRGKYYTPEEALEIQAGYRGGLVGLVDACLSEVGCRRVSLSCVYDGDVGVLRMAGELYCGIRRGGGWFVHGDRSVLFTREARVIAAWRLPTVPGSVGNDGNGG